MRLLLIVFLLFSARAQAELTEIPSRYSFHTGFNFNGKDFFLGIGGGYQNLKNQWGAHLNIDLRPFYKKVIIDRDAQTKDQYFERKTLISLGVEKRFLTIPAGTSIFRLLAGCQGGFMYGNYRGVKTSPDLELLVQPYGGISLEFGINGSMKAGYTWLDINNDRVPAGRFFMGFTFYLGEV